MNSEMKERLDWFGFDAAARAALTAAGQIIEPHLDAMLERFYARIRATPAMAAYFETGGQLEAARRAQRRHWQKLFSGRFDADYAASAARIGDVHFHIELPLKNYLAAYASVGAELEQVVIRGASGFFGLVSRRRAMPLVGAVHRALLLDTEITATAFHMAHKNAAAAERDENLTQLSRAFEARVSEIFGRVSAAANQLSGTAQTMSGHASTTSRQAQSAAAAAEEAAANVQSVSGATEQLSASIREISAQVQESAGIAAQATEKARETDRLVQELRAASDRIGTVVELIADIASQTNLLALNATVEAARAGDAGKGFAVVANEVKQLSTSTAKATEDIRTQIEQMQTETASAVDAIRGISEIVGRNGEISESLANAVEQQREATNDIAGNAEATAAGTGRMAQSIETMSGAASDSDAASAQVLQAVAELSQSSDALRSEMESFVAEMRAA